MQNEIELPLNVLPIACNLSASEQTMRDEEVAGIFKDAQQVNEIADGYAFSFPGTEAWAARLLQFIVGERSSFVKNSIS